MTVRELIQALSTMPQDAEVEIAPCGNTDHSAVGSVLGVCDFAHGENETVFLDVALCIN